MGLPRPFGVNFDNMDRLALFALADWCIMSEG